MTQDTAKEKRSKWGLFSHKGDKDHINNNHNPRFDAANSDAAAFDSTYGGSEASATSGSSLGDNHRHSTNNKNRNDTVNHNDNSQTVTTTTTTTTTTTSGSGSNTSSSHNADRSQRGNNGHEYENTHRPSIPSKSTRRDHSPPMSGTNYSRPSNSSPLSPSDAHPNALSSNPANSQYGPHSATLQGLKIAAAGIHVWLNIYKSFQYIIHSIPLSHSFPYLSESSIQKNTDTYTFNPPLRPK